MPHQVHAIALRLPSALLGAVLLIALALALLPAAASATAPGANGRIVFVSDRDDPAPFPHDFDLFSMNPNGTGVTHVTNDGPNNQDPAYSPDGKKIAYTSHGANAEIVVVNANGSSPVNVTNNGAQDEDPSFSPDGSKIAFRSNRDSSLFEIYVANANGTGTPLRLTNNAVFDGEPTWSPSGSHVIFNEVVQGPSKNDNEIVRIKADGSELTPTNLTNNAALDSNPSVAPDGRIAFSRLVSGTNWDVFVMNANGSGQTNLTPGSSVLDTNPAFSPDGKRIAFTRGFQATAEIYVMGDGGSNPVNITNNTNLNINDTKADWQPLPTLASVSAGQLTVAAQAGRTNNLRVFRPSSAPARFHVSDLPNAGAGLAGTPVLPRAGCTRVTLYVADCGTSVSSILMLPGDLKDAATNATSTPATLNGDTGPDSLFGGTSADVLLGGAGLDLFRAGAGNDSVRAKDGAKDTVIDCGGGLGDKANTDVADPAPTGCETVTH